MKQKSKLVFDKFIIIFLLLQPFIDALTMLQIKYNINNLTVSMVLRTIFFIIIFLYVLKNKKYIKYILLFILYFIIQTLYTYFFTKNYIITDMANVIQIFYLPIAMIFFMEYENDKINNKFIFVLNLVYFCMIIIPYLLHFGLYASDLYSGKSGFYGLFYGGNEISMILMILLPVSIKYLINIKNIFLCFIYFIFLILCTLLIATKTLLFGIIIVSLYYIFNYLKNNIKLLSKTKKILILLSVLFTLILVIILIPRTAMYSNVKLAMKTFRVNDKNLFSVYSLNKIVFSGRLEFLKNINNIYLNSDALTILFGLGKSILLNIKTIEIDIFDLFYSIGVVGFTIYILFMVKLVKKVGLKNVYKFDFIFMILISMVVGHVLISTNVSLFLALLVILNKNKELYQDKN